MKAVILAGGLGTRLSEETSVIPKPLVEIGDEPILWHILKTFSSHGIKEFVICCGYKGFLIKKYFADYHLKVASVTIDLASSERTFHSGPAEDWKVTLLDTGLDTMTGGRLKRAASLVNGEPFLMTYGDGVGSIDVSALIDFHASHGKKATVTVVQPTGRFGAVYLTENDSQVRSFMEKPMGDSGYVNGGYFVLDPSVLDLIEDDTTIWEHGPMGALTEAGELVAYRHAGFWHPMDTLRDKVVLNDMWKAGRAPWCVW